MPRLACVLWLLVGLAVHARAAEPVQADLLLVGGTIYDGSGADPVVGDVAIKGGRIVAVGTFETARADLKIDCAGRIVCPGFIDLHNHSDGPIVSPLTRGNANYLTQGCTTIVTGNCGSGPIDVGKFYDQVDAAGAGTHVAHLLPQGSLREAVVGTAQRAAAPEEIEKMRQRVDLALKEGAWGMSSGLIYVPSVYADTAELAALAEIVGTHGGLYASHIRGEGLELLTSVNEAIEIGRRGKCRVHISHFKASGPEAWGLVRQAAEVIETARANGERVTADQYPYAASSTSLAATLIPTWARAGGEKQLVVRLDDPEQGPRIRAAILELLRVRADKAPIRIARYQPRQDWVGKSLEEIAAGEKLSLLDVVLDITRNGGAAIVSFNMHEDDVRYVMQLPWVATASDGRAYIPTADRPHPRSYGTFSRKIGRYALAEKVVPAGLALRSATGLPADILGLTDRGYLKPGQAADVVVLDPAKFTDTATYDDPHRYSVGAEYVFVAGQPAIYAARPTGALAGRALRRTATP